MFTYDELRTFTREQFDSIPVPDDQDYAKLIKRVYTEKFGAVETPSTETEPEQPTETEPEQPTETEPDSPLTGEWKPKRKQALSE
jgi:hypothetical protein